MSERIAFTSLAIFKLFTFQTIIKKSLTLPINFLIIKPRRLFDKLELIILIRGYRLICIALRKKKNSYRCFESSNNSRLPCSLRFSSTNDRYMHERAVVRIGFRLTRRCTESKNSSLLTEIWQFGLLMCHADLFRRPAARTSCSCIDYQFASLLLVLLQISINTARLLATLINSIFHMVELIFIYMKAKKIF